MTKKMPKAALHAGDAQADHVYRQIYPQIDAGERGRKRRRRAAPETPTTTRKPRFRMLLVLSVLGVSALLLAACGEQAVSEVGQAGDEVRENAATEAGAGGTESEPAVDREAGTDSTEQAGVDTGEGDAGEGGGVAVATITLEPEAVSRFIDLSGEIRPVSTVDVFASTGGELTSLTVSRGDRVRRGEVIGAVDPSRPGQRFAPSSIEAPIDGTVIAVLGRIGSQITPQAPVAQVATVDRLEIVTAVPERHIGTLATGRPAVVLLDAFPGEEFAARIAQLSPTVAPQSRTLETILTFVRRDTRIRPGMFARVRLVAEERPDALMVPQSAVLRRRGETFIYVVGEEQRAERRLVELGIDQSGRAELLSGAAAGEQVVVRGQNLLADQARVRVVTGASY